MDIEQFKEFGRAVIEYLADYHEHIRERPVLPTVSPGYLRPLVPDTMPEGPESWQDILKDMERVIMPGLTHWQAPGFHGFFPAGASFPSVVGELMSAGLGVLGFSWMSSPACTELEMIVMDWLAKAMDLPADLQNGADSDGGGCIQGSACEATLLGLLVAKEKAVRRIRKEHPQLTEQQVKSRLVCYSSNQSNSSVEKASMLASVPIRLLEPDAAGRLGGEALETAIRQDLRLGLIPCYMVATLGTTATCAFDRLDELGCACRRHDVWLHVDAAYAGVALICPELRPQMRAGLHHADSIVTNLHKWLMVNFECSPMWFKSCRDIVETFSVERIYLSHRPDSDAPDLRNWQIPLSRRFRSLKVWFTLRTYGLRGLQAHIRNHVQLAELFGRLLLADSRFELAAPTCMGLVCFRPKGDNKLCSVVIEELNKRKKVYMTPGKLFDNVFIRFVLCSPAATEEDVHNCVREVLAATDVATLAGGEQSDVYGSEEGENGGVVSSNVGSEQRGVVGPDAKGGQNGVVSSVVETDPSDVVFLEVGSDQNGELSSDTGSYHGDVVGFNVSSDQNGVVSSDVGSDQSSVVVLNVSSNQNGVVSSGVGCDQNGVVSSDVGSDQSSVVVLNFGSDQNDVVSSATRSYHSEVVGLNAGSDQNDKVVLKVGSDQNDVSSEAGSDKSDVIDLNIGSNTNGILSLYAGSDKNGVVSSDVGSDQSSVVVLNFGSDQNDVVSSEAGSGRSNVRDFKVGSDQNGVVSSEAGSDQSDVVFLDVGSEQNGLISSDAGSKKNDVVDLGS